MRKDMFEVIIERPRWGSRWARACKGRRKERTERAIERAPSKVGMKHDGRTKSLNENLAPLIRFLQKHTGRPWSKVRSEMSAVLSMSSTVQKHVLDHVRQLVEENPRMVEGVPCSPSTRGGANGSYQPLAGYGWHGRFYVCPKTGLLREARRVPRKRETQAAGDSAVDARPGMGR